MTEDAALLSCCGLRKTFGKDAGLVRAARVGARRPTTEILQAESA